ncbi:MAG: alpha/beta hydrolase [Prolixibacteraceae bacterium]|jgi:acetyl esterase/lipase|nr:alpha/beta hydrolase [Prolixibacteraceae bacterium]
MKSTLLILLVFSYMFCIGQESKSFPTDTSFTLNSAYQKEVKKYPFIKPVFPVLPATIDVKKDLVYASYGGRDMHLDIYFSKNTQKPKPAILFIFGGGWKSGNKEMEAPMAIHFAQKGYVTATIEYRLSTEAIYPAAVIDIKTAIRWMHKNAEALNIDPNQIIISGTSAGGQLAALLGATNNSSLFIDSTFYPEFSSNVQAIIDIDGVLAFIHPESGEGADKPGKPSAATLWFGGNQYEKTNDWNEASALTHVNESMPPILFVNSSRPRFHAGRDDMIAILDSLNIYSEVYTIPDTPHPFWLFEPWFTPTVNQMEQFLYKIKKQ